MDPPSSRPRSFHMKIGPPSTFLPIIGTYSELETKAAMAYAGTSCTCTPMYRNQTTQHRAQAHISRRIHRFPRTDRQILATLVKRSPKKNPRIWLGRATDRQGSQASQPPHTPQRNKPRPPGLSAATSISYLREAIMYVNVTVPQSFPFPTPKTPHVSKQPPERVKTKTNNTNTPLGSPESPDSAR